MNCYFPCSGTNDGSIGPMINLPVYPRGFLYSKDAIVLPADAGHFQKQSTAYGTFWFSPDTEHYHLEAQGRVVVLVGEAIYVNLSESESNTEIIVPRILDLWAKKGLKAVEDYLYDLAGRYALFLLDSQNQHVYQDAHGMRSIYYMNTEPIVASHESLIAPIAGNKENDSVLGNFWLALKWRQTSYSGVMALLPNHRLNADLGTTERFFPFRENPFTSESFEKKISMIERLWQEQIRLLAKKYDIAISLTGGLDSRVSLSMSRAHWDEISAFTYTVSGKPKSAWAQSLAKDETLVQQILKVVDVPHEFLYLKDEYRLTDEENKIADKNSAGSHGRWLIKAYREQVVGKNTIHLRANLHETARNYFHQYRNTRNPIAGLQRLLSVAAVQKDPSLKPKLEQVKKAFNLEIQAAGLSSLPKSYEPLDMYYWEARQARWFSEVFNETDAAFDTYIPFNHRRIIDLALSFSADQRKEGFLFKELINRNSPILNFFGINETQNLYEKNRSKAVRKPIASSDLELERKLWLIDAAGNETTSIVVGREFFLPATHALKGQSAEVRWRLDELAGTESVDVRLDIENKYQRVEGRDHLILQIKVDGNSVMTQDLSKWGYKFGVTLTSLPSTSVVAASILSLRNLQKDSWEKASRTFIDIHVEPSQYETPTIVTDNPTAIQV